MLLSLKNYIFGTGAHATEVAELLDLQMMGEAFFITEEEEEALLPTLSNSDFTLVIGVGNPFSRLKILKRWDSLIRNFKTVQHKNSFISPSASIGSGVLIQFGNVVSSYAVIENGVLLNWNSTIGHHTTIGEGSVINPSASVSGNCRLGSGVLIGTGARVLEGITIGDSAIIGAGAVVTRDVPELGRFVGVPARAML